MASEQNTVLHSSRQWQRPFTNKTKLCDEHNETLIIDGYTENSNSGNYFVQLTCSLNIPTANYTESALIHKELHMCIEHTNTHTHTKDKNQKREKFSTKY